MARRVRPRLPYGRPRQSEGQAGLLPVLFGEEEAREADKARLALGLSARKERGEASQLWSFADIHEANGNLVSKNAAFDKQYLSDCCATDPYLARIEGWD